MYHFQTRTFRLQLDVWENSHVVKHNTSNLGGVCSITLLVHQHIFVDAWVLLISILYICNSFSDGRKIENDLFLGSLSNTDFTKFNTLPGHCLVQWSTPIPARFEHLDWAMTNCISVSLASGTKWRVYIGFIITSLMNLWFRSSSGTVVPFAFIIVLNITVVRSGHSLNTMAPLTYVTSC